VRIGRNNKGMIIESHELIAQIVLI